MNKSETITKLADALSKAQGEFPNVKKDASNPFFKSKYADLAGLVETVRPVLLKHGLSVSQLPGFDVDKNCIVLTTILLHCSGEYLSQELPMPILDLKAQSIGSALTYARRYALQSVLCLAAEDDDGNAASGRQEGHPEPPPSPARRPANVQTALKPTSIHGRLSNPTESDKGLWFQLGTQPVYVRRGEDGILPKMEGLSAGVEAELEVFEKKNKSGGKYYEFQRVVTIVPPTDNQSHPDEPLPF